MEIVLNGEPEQRPATETIGQLVESLGLTGSPCAVEVNREIVPKSQHEQRRIQDGDEIEIVTLVGGG